MSVKKTITVNEVTYDSKSDAIRALLASGMKKADVARATDSNYSFVVTVSRAVVDPNAAAEKQAKAAIRQDRKAKAEAEKAQKAKARAEKKALKAAALLKKAEDEAAEAKTPIKQTKAAMKKAVAVKKAVKKTVKKAVKKTAPVAQNLGVIEDDEELSDEDSLINSILADECDMPADIADEMRADGFDL